MMELWEGADRPVAALRGMSNVDTPMDRQVAPGAPMNVLRTWSAVCPAARSSLPLVPEDFEFTNQGST